MAVRERSLDVWMNGTLVGNWSSSRRGVDVFQYADSWMESAYSRPLSLSLRFVPGNAEHRGPAVAWWFENLLPDSAEIRSRIARRFRVAPSDSVALLAAIGRDCVGAVQLVPAGSDPGNIRQVSADLLTDPDVAAIIRSATSDAGVLRSVDDEREPLRLSIAGAQEKTALLRMQNAWYLPRGSTPTTHIIKLPLGRVGNIGADLSGSVENEWLCLRILSAFGLPVAHAEMARFADDVGEIRALIVERFDRAWCDATSTTPAWIQRLPQEDFCQATGMSPDQKYETDGGPGVGRCLSVLRDGGNATADSCTFALSQLAFWLLAAPDGHAKNFSVFLRRRDYVMTPLYDVISAWPIIGRGAREYPIQKMQLAMSLRGKSKPRLLDKIHLRHWRRLADDAGGDEVFAAMIAMVEQVPRAISVVEGELPSDFPEVIWERITTGMRRQSERFLAMVRG